MALKTAYRTVDQQNQENFIPVHRIGISLLTKVDHNGNPNHEEASGNLGAVPGKEKWATLTGGFLKQLPKAVKGEHWSTPKPVFSLNGDNG